MKKQKKRAEKPCRTPPSELQTEPYSASYDQKPFWKVPSKSWHMLQEGKSCCQEGKSCFQAKTTGGPGRARICPAGIFPTSAFSRRSGGKKPTLRLRGGRASGVPPGAFAEVGRQICLREASRRSGMHRKPTLEAENPPVWAEVGQIQARQGFSRPPPFFRGRAIFCPA